MPLLLLLVCIAVLGGIAVVAAGRGSSMPPAPPDRAPWAELPAGPVDRAAVERLRFSLGFRGYRMDEVDDVLDRLVEEIEARDRRISELEASPAEAERAED